MRLRANGMIFENLFSFVGFGKHIVLKYKYSDIIITIATSTILKGYDLFDILTLYLTYYYPPTLKH